jgi:hypothetical protein
MMTSVDQMIDRVVTMIRLDQLEPYRADLSDHINPI